MAFGLTRFDLNTITRRIELPEISPDPAAPWALLVRYAGEGNRAWMSTMIKLGKSGDGDSTDPLAAGDRYAAATAGTVIVGWENITDDAGALVEFSEDACREFVAELRRCVPDVWRKRVDAFVAEIKNFREGPPLVDPDDLGKEPPRG